MQPRRAPRHDLDGYGKSQGIVAFGIAGVTRHTMSSGFEDIRDKRMHGEYKMPGGKLVVIDLDLRNGRLADVRLSGDFFLEPDEALVTINRALEGQSGHADETSLAMVVRTALAPDVMMYGISPEAIAVAVCRALNRESAA
ncbi:MAG TPA: hypothetical protein VN043_11850 [Rhodanobacter sp.]|nr:hypothetical protein [Rhodanobacter sp.]